MCNFQGYFDCLRLEKMNQNIAITLVCPGPVQTDFLAESFTEQAGEVNIDVSKEK